jgi:hypothetical protein
LKEAAMKTWLCGFFAVTLFAVATTARSADEVPSASGGPSGKPWYDARLRAFFTAKEKQAHELDGTPAAPGEVWQYFDAGTRGDWNTVTNLWVWLSHHSHQYTDSISDPRLDKVWSPIMEAEMAWGQYVSWKEKYVLAFGNDIIKSIPVGSIYFGGSEPGRGVITAMQDSQIDGRPFFTLTQNALVDSTYLDYLRAMYGQKIYICSKQDLTGTFSEYAEDLRSRYLHDHDPAKAGEPRQLKPGEEQTNADGHLMISSTVSMMTINGMLARVIFDRNPAEEFYIEESFPLDWMYPYLLPNGLILKVNREPLSSLSEDVLREDHEYWFRCLQPMIGGWLHDETPLSEVAGFAHRVYLKHDLAGFAGDREFMEDNRAQQTYANARSSIASVYAWRANHAGSPAERQRMTREADFAYRQAFALCPTSPEVVFGYAQLLINSKRADDALLVVGTALDFDSTNISLQNLMQGLRDSKAAR